MSCFHEKKSSKFILNRIDTDSVFLTVPRHLSDELNTIFPSTDYKLECDEVYLIVCSKDKCYRYSTSTKLFIVQPGLQLTLFERNYCDIFYKFKFVKSRFRTINKIEEHPFVLIDTFCKGYKY